MNTDQPAIVIGMGEMGGSFARGMLRLGYPVVPVLRDSDVGEIAKRIPDPTVTVVTVGEADLDATVASLPRTWRSTAVLIQNELLPRSWEAHGFTNPTVAVVWFEKKPGRTEKVIIPTPVMGSGAKVLVAALDQIGVPAVTLTSEADLLFELVRKNMYILTANIAGLVSKGTVSDLWSNHRALAEAVAYDVHLIQEWLTATKLDHDALVAGMLEAFDADPEHGATGRSAPARLARALSHADQAGLEVRQLREIHAQLAESA